MSIRVKQYVNKCNRIAISLIFLLTLRALSLPAFGQSTLKELQEKKQETERLIQATNEQLSKTKTEKRSTAYKASLIKQNIKNRKILIANLDAQLNIIHKSLMISQDSIRILNNDLGELKSDYSQMLVTTYFQLKQQTLIHFVFSANSFQQILRRLTYTKVYAKHRMDKANQIKFHSMQLQKVMTDLEKKKKQSEDVLKSRKNELISLSADEKQLSMTLSGLSKKEQALQGQLKESQALSRRLSAQIARIIEEESRKEKQKMQDLKKTNEVEFKKLQDFEVKLSAQFSQNKGRLPWPVGRGSVITKFGVHEHSLRKGVYITSNGIDIATEAGSVVSSIFDGQVKRVFGSGASLTILIQHGAYYTVYSNLRSVRVREGDSVKVGQGLGTVSDNSDPCVLHFELWKGVTKLNPEQWLK